MNKTFLLNDKWKSLFKQNYCKMKSAKLPER